MDSTVAVQTKDLGFSFHAARNSVIACRKSLTLQNEPRRTLLEVSSPHQRSTRLSQLDLVGTKCGTNRGWRFSHPFTWGCLCVPEVSLTQCTGLCRETLGPAGAGISETPDGSAARSLGR